MSACTNVKQTQRLEVRRSEKLIQTLASAIRNVRPRVLIQSGTFLGTSSARMILDALGATRPEAFYTIEVLPSLIERTRVNMAAFPRVQVLGSDRYSRGGNRIHRGRPGGDPALDLFVDFFPDSPSGYLNEIGGGIGI